MSLAHAWQVYLNSRESVREMAVVDKREPATSDGVGSVSFVRLNPVSVPDRGLLVAALNRAFGIGLYQVECVAAPHPVPRSAAYLPAGGGGVPSPPQRSRGPLTATVGCE